MTRKGTLTSAVIIVVSLFACLLRARSLFVSAVEADGEYGYLCYEVRGPKGVVNMEDGWHLKVRESRKEYKEIARPKDRKDCVKQGEKWMTNYEKSLKRRNKK